MRIVLLLIIFAGGSFARQVDFCAANDDSPYLKMATKTAYHFVNGGRYQRVPNCQPLQIWMLNRHGSRFPHMDTMQRLLALPKLRDQIINSHENRRMGRMCNDDLEKLKNWTPHPDMTAKMAERLTPQGAEDSKLLARQLQLDFPELLETGRSNLTSQNYVFRSSKSLRTEATMESFMEGMFGSRYAVNPVGTPDNDMLLKGDENCERWKNGDNSDPPYMEEHSKFLNSSEFQNVVQNVSQRIGFQYPLSTDTILDMYDMCRYEKSWELNKIPPWCAVFSKWELQVLEYAEDIEYYYGSGYGRKVNAQLGCFPVQDMLKNFRALERGEIDGKPKGIFYFTHSSTFLSFLTSMKIAKDGQHLLADNYKNMMNRQWRTSFINPFNSNFVAVFYRCNDKDSPLKVMFHMQARPVLYEGCDVGLCDWEFLKNRLRNVADECSSKFCSDGNFAIRYEISILMIISMLLSISVFQL